MTIDQLIHRVGALTRFGWMYQEIAIELEISHEDVLRYRQMEPSDGAEEEHELVPRESPPTFLPTHEEIAAFCAEFQSRWSTAEERFRSVYVRRWSLQEWRTIDYCEG